MGLTDAQRVRFARHLLLPELGEAGQERLLASSARAEPAADAGALAVCGSYLSRAGVALVTGTCDAAPVKLPTTPQLQQLAGAPELLEAARALAGAFAAVEAVKAAAGIGQPAELPTSFSLAAEEV